MTKASMLPVPNRFQYAHCFLGMYYHVFVFHLHPTNFQLHVVMRTIMGGGPNRGAFARCYGPDCHCSC